MPSHFKKDFQYYKFCLYGFFKNLRFFDVFLMLFFLEKGISYVEIGILYSAREIAILTMEIPSGVISDALGRRKTLIGSIQKAIQTLYFILIRLRMLIYYLFMVL